MPSIRERIENSLKHNISESDFKSTHSLDFEVSPFEMDFNCERFKVGTCYGLYTNTPSAYQIIAITNNVKGNGHLQDVFDWFENSCRRDKKNLMVMEVGNKDFKNHLIKKRGFATSGKDDVIKKLKRIK